MILPRSARADIRIAGRVLVSEPRVRWRSAVSAIALVLLLGQMPAPARATDPPTSTPAPSAPPDSEPGTDGPPSPSAPTPALPENPDLSLLQSGGGVLVTYRADGWKFKQVAHGGLPGFEAPGYDDSSFGTAGAPFGTTHSGCPLGPQVRTAWTVDTDMLLRRTIPISGPFEPLAVTVTVDNDVEVYWNGQLVEAPSQKEGCAAYDDYQFAIPPSMQSTENVLAVRAKDRGYASFIDVLVAPLTLGADASERWPAGWDPNQTNPTGSEAEPVNTLTGAYYTSVTDLILPGRGLDFAFRRDYSSALTASGPLGPGWVHSYDARLTFEPEGVVYFHSETGAIIPFFDDGTGGFYPAAGVLSKLTPISGGYSVTRPDQVTYRFDTAGLLTSIRDRNSNQLTLTYTAGQLTRITDTVGRFIDLTYDGSGRLATLSGPPSRTVIYGYDLSGRLSTVTDMRGKATTYTYEAGGRLESIIDPNNHTVLTNEYGPDGRIVAQTDARGKRGTFDWDPVTETSTFTDARGGYWVDDYDNGLLVAETDPLGNTTTYTYDAAFQLRSIRDARGNTTQMIYDRRGNLLIRWAPAPFNSAERFGYTFRNDIAVEIDARGRVTYFGYNGAGNLTSIDGPGSSDWTFGRATTGLLTSSRDPRGKTTTYGYDAQANRNRITTPLGNVTTMTYDAAGRLVTLVEPRGNVAGADPGQYTTALTYDEADHLLTTTDPLGNVTAQTYDNAGNLLTATDANQHTTTYSYDEANHLATVTDARNGVTTYGYDDVGNLVSRTDANQHTTTYGHDLAKRMTSMTAPLNRAWTFGYDAAGNQTSRLDPNGNTVTYVYDNRNRLSQVLYNDPQTPNVTYGYDANSSRTSMVDGSGTETYTYDPFNRLQSATRSGVTFSYAYDAAGNLTSRTYPGQTVQTLTYDDDGRLATAAGSAYTYDAAGNVLTVATPDGLTARYIYDRAGRLAEVAHTSASDTLSRFSYALDPVGNRTAMTTREGTVTYHYDELDRLTEACWSQTSCPGGPPAAPGPCIACVGGLLTRPSATVNPPPGETFRSYTYDPVGNRSTEASNAGTSTYAYDAADRLTGISGGTFPGAVVRPPSSNTGPWTAGASGYLSDNLYATAAPAKNQTLSQRYGTFSLGTIPAGATITRVTVSVEWAVSASNAPATLTAQAYLGGSPYGSPLVNTSKPTSDTVQTFELTGLTRDNLVNGNFEVEVRATRGGGGSAFTARLDAASVRVEYTTTSQTFSYDPNGNQTSVGATTYIYDLADRLKTATVGATTETYIYAGDGTRLSASTGAQASQTTKYLWDLSAGLPQLALERDGGNALLRSYRYGHDLLSQTAGASSYYYHHDGLGSVADVTGSTGSSLWWSEYYPYGLARQAGGTQPTVQPFRFTGEQLDVVTGLYHLRARQYDPSLGRFLSSDPLPSSLTDPYVAAYVYVRDNPCSSVDPSGLAGEEPFDWGEAFDFVLNEILVPCSYATLQLVEEGGLIVGGGAALVAPEPALTKALGAGALTVAAYNYEHYSQSVAWCVGTREEQPTAPSIPFELP